MAESGHNLTQKEYQKLLLEHSDYEHAINDLKRRMKDCENQQEAMNNLIRSVDRMTITIGNMVEKQKELTADVKALKEAPTESFNYYKRTIISCTITTILGAIIGAVISLVLT